MLVNLNQLERKRKTFVYAVDCVSIQIWHSKTYFHHELTISNGVLKLCVIWG